MDNELYKVHIFCLSCGRAKNAANKDKEEKMEASSVTRAPDRRYGDIRMRAWHKFKYAGNFLDLTAIPIGETKRGRLTLLVYELGVCVIAFFLSNVRAPLRELHRCVCGNPIWAEKRIVKKKKKNYRR